MKITYHENTLKEQIDKELQSNSNRLPKHIELTKEEFYVLEKQCGQRLIHDMEPGSALKYTIEKRSQRGELRYAGLPIIIVEEWAFATTTDHPLFRSRKRG